MKHGLEDQLQPKLERRRTTRSQERVPCRHVGRSGVPAEKGWRGWVIIADAVELRLHELRAVEQVEELRSELRAQPFVDAGVLEDRGVQILKWRRAPTFCKAPLKKSTSSVFSAGRRFS